MTRYRGCERGCARHRVDRGTAVCGDADRLRGNRARRACVAINRGLEARIDSVLGVNTRGAHRYCGLAARAHCSGTGQHTRGDRALALGIEHQIAGCVHCGIGDPSARARCDRRVAQELPAAFIRPVLRREIDTLTVAVSVAHELIDFVTQKPLVVEHTRALGECGELGVGVVLRGLEVVMDGNRLCANDVARKRKPQRHRGGGFAQAGGDRQRKRLDHCADLGIVNRRDRDIARLAARSGGHQINGRQIGIGHAVDAVEHQRTATTHRRPALRTGRHGNRRGAARGIDRCAAVDADLHIAARAGFARAVGHAREESLNIVQHIVATEGNAHRHRHRIASGGGCNRDRA